jgi:methionyl aminopeptidase
MLRSSITSDDARAHDRVYYKTDEEVGIIRANCLLVCKALAHVATLIRPGVNGRLLDREAEALIRDHQAEPGFKGYRDFPSTLCISVNEGVVHGIPVDKEFKDGDIVSVDCGVYHQGYYGDAAYTFALGEIEDNVRRLLQATKEALYLGIEQAAAGKRLGDIGYTIQHYCERVHHFSVVRELVGHGLGKNLHEPPEVPNYGRRGSGMVLKEGLVIAIEPMINLGRKEVVQGKDGWTVSARDRKPSAHFEHTVVVRKDKADILSDHSGIEEMIKNNPDLSQISSKK